VTCFVSERCEAMIVTRPRDTVGFVGDTAVLQCRTNESQSSVALYWSRYSRGTNIASSKTGVYKRYPRLSLNRSADGQFDLVINSTNSNDAGSYGCTEGFNAAVTAELVLLGKCLVCLFFLHDSYRRD